ncbi:DUF1990 family protein [Microbacterium aurum]
MPSSFTLVTDAAVSPEALYALSLDIDAHVASMRQSGERAVGGVTSGSIGLGESVTWRARHFGIRFTMTSRITELEEPTRFVDEQVRGPFRSFRHEHRFEQVGSGTRMTDTIELASPFFGRLAERVVLVPYLRRLIRQRNAHLLTALGVAPSTDPEEVTWEPGVTHPFRAAQSETVIGRGDACWQRAASEVLRWGVKTRSGFAVASPHDVMPGERLTITARLGPFVVREPVEVVAVIRQPDRVGFSYRALPGHPVRGEEAFVVHRHADAVLLSIRSLTAPAARGPWRPAYPLLRVAQVIARRRYRRALR